MSVTAAAGFQATGLACGIKANGVFDLAVIRAASPATAVAVFTNSTTAAPAVLMGRKVVADGSLQAVVVASGCANAGTGAEGMAALERVANDVAGVLGVEVSDVLVSTTGPIGPVLPDELVRSGVRQGVLALADSTKAGTAAASAILTTDSVAKEATLEADGYVIGGMAKGAGMVRPDMATMLSFITTDAVIDLGDLQSALRDAVDITFNCLNIDGCQSTNDTVLVMASGSSGVEVDVAMFTEHLTTLCRDLVAQMAADAEGASRVVTIEVTGALDDSVARDLGKSVADAAIVRASFYGGDSNWGRLLAAAGVTGHPVSPADINVSYAGVEVARDGVAADHDEAALLNQLESGDFTIDLAVGDGPGKATIVTTDLTPEYVVFNGERS